MKILIGCPTCDRYRYCVEEWIKRVKEIINFSNKHEIDYLLVDNSKENDFFNELKNKNIKIIKAPYLDNVKERIAESRNLLRKKVLDENYDYLFSLEQDIIPEKDILKKLLETNKKIISAYYSKSVLVGLKDKETGEVHNAVIELSLVWLQKGKEMVKRAWPQQVKDKGILQVGGFGLGCVLIHREILEKIKFRILDPKKAFDDFIFCLDAEKNDYELFLESNIQVKHLHKPWTEKEYVV